MWASAAKQQYSRERKQAYRRWGVVITLLQISHQSLIPRVKNNPLNWRGSAEITRLESHAELPTTIDFFTIFERSLIQALKTLEHFSVNAWLFVNVLQIKIAISNTTQIFHRQTRLSNLVTHRDEIANANTLKGP